MTQKTRIEPVPPQRASLLTKIFYRVAKRRFGEVPEPFAVAGNQITKSGKQYDYYWAAGLLPTGVKTIVYTFPDGSMETAVVADKYWLMHHWTPVGTYAATDRIKVRLLGANDAVLGDLRLEPGLHTCAQITHGC